MLSQRVRGVWERQRQRVVGGSLLVVALAWIYSAAFTQRLPVEETILFAVLFVSFSLEMAARDVSTIGEEVESIEDVAGDVADIKAEMESPPALFPTVDDANPEVQDAIVEGSPDAVYFLEYNGLKVQELVNAAADRNCDVHLLVKDPAEAISPRQTRNILSNVEGLYEQLYDYDRLTIHLYSKPASVKLRKVGDGPICMGWYTFEQKGTSRRNPIWGNDNPMVWVSRDRHPTQYMAVNEWFKRVYHERWSTGRSLKELYESDDCPDRLREFVNSEAKWEAKEEMEAWLDAVSAPTDLRRDELF